MKKMRRKGVVTSVVAFVMASSAQAAFADDVTDSINEALKAYAEKSYSEAVEDLNYAVQLINQKKSGALTQFLPKALDGWSADTASSEAVGAAMFGGAITAKREYTKGESTIEITIVSDSPVLQGMMMMFSNPMFAASGGGKLERIKRQKAIVKYNKKERSGEINIMVAKRFLITLKGDNVSLDEMRAYAKAIAYKRLAALP